MEQASSPRLRAKFFGKLEVWLDGVDLTPQLAKRNKTALLLKFLLSKRGRVFTQDQLLEALFPDIDPDKSSQNLRGRISELREILEPTLARGSSSQFVLRVGPQKYCFNDKISCWLDVEEFQRLINAAEEHADEEEKIRLLQETFALYRGDMLEDSYDDWVLEDRDYFKDLCIKTLQQLVHACTKCHDYSQAIGYAKQILAKNSLQEEAHRALMYLYYVTGDRNAALQQFRECEQILKTELGIEPLPETKMIFREIEEQASQARLEELTVQARELIRRYPELGVPFVGRAEEWQRLTAAWDDAKQGKGKALLISGEAGVGKSRLAQEFLSYAPMQGSLVLSGRCYEVKGKLPYQAIIDSLRHGFSQFSSESLSQISPLWLSEVIKLLPELGEMVSTIRPSAQLLSPEQDRNRLFEGLCQFFVGLSRQQSIVVFWDDLQWADESTLQFMNYLIPRLSDKRIILLGAYRSEEVEPAHPLWEILQRFLCDRMVTELRVTPLQASEIEKLVQGMLKSRKLDGLWPWIFEESKGVPFFVVELVKSFIEAGALTLDAQGSWRMGYEKLIRDYVPDSVRALIETRLRRINRPSRQLLDLAAVTGRSFTVELLSQSLGRQAEEVFDRLEELLRAYVIVEEQDQFNFRHDVIREIVYSGLVPEQRRKRLHKIVGETLERMYSQRLEMIAGELAHHFLQGEIWQKALNYSLKAGEAARKAYANQEAITHLSRAVQLAEQTNNKEALQTALTYLGHICVFSGKVDESLEYCLKALDLASEPHARARVYDTLFLAHNYKREHEKALIYCQQAIRELGEQDKSLELARAYDNASTALCQLGRSEEAIQCCHRSLRILGEIEDTGIMAQVYTHLSVAYRLHDNFGQAIEYDSRAIETAEKSNQLTVLAQAYYNAGITYFSAGKPIKADEFLTKALSAFEQVGDSIMMSWCCQLKCWSCIQSRNLPLAIEYGQRSLKIASQFSHMRELAIAHGLLACLYLGQGSEIQAKDHFSKALEIAGNDGNLYIEVAITFTLLGYPNDALEWLKKGVPFMTSSHIARVKSNRHLKTLHSCPVFKKLFEHR